MEQTGSAPQGSSLWELARLFLRLGATSFGGPAVHIALMHTEVVQRRQWLSEQQFLDLLSATNLIPGPNSTEMALHIGWQRRGIGGLLVAGLSFIVPAMLITGALAMVYVRFGAIPSVSWLLYGVKPVMLSVVLQAILSLAPNAAPTMLLRLLALFAVVVALLGVHELLILLGTGLVAVFLSRFRGRGSHPAAGALFPTLSLLPIGSIASHSAVSVPSLFWVFLKTGSVLYGSGYVLLAFLRADLVHRLGWLTESQLMDAIAVGQVTPGPVFTTATFIGYLLAGPKGALLATLGIFLPAFVLVALSGPLVPRLRAIPFVAALLQGVNVASWALMVVVTLQLGRAALCDVPALLLFGMSALLLLWWRTNATWLVIGGALLGWLVQVCGLSRCGS